MLVSLRMLYAPTPLREPAAWFLAMETASEWLEEMARWQTPLAAARLSVLPTSLKNPQPCGVLVRGVAPSPVNISPQVLPYGVIGRRLFLPINARIDPEVSVAELNALLDDEAIYVWHPQAGLIVLSAAEEMRVADLLAPPTSQDGAWDSALPGLIFNSRLLSIQPEITFSAEQMLQEARGDIGTEPIDLERMPEASNEPSTGPLAGLGRTLEGGLAKAVQWLTSQLPHTGSQRNWINELEDWAARRLQQVSESLSAAQNRELHRLMDMLKNSPDEGLRFALPMGGDQHRGVAPPSSRLGARNVDFRLGQLGGGPADVWNVPSDYQQQLIARYRELAAREITLGRHRRAAYIFATLLGDFRSAAATLADGGHHREAAVLYEERLSQPLEAAHCLRKGGLWTEAIVLYEKLGHHETVGDLYQQLEQAEEAATAWRRAVDKHLAAEDFLSAAVLLEKKLQLPQEAFDRLLAAWPRSRQAESGLSAAFQLLARHAWHDLAGSLVDQLPTALRSSGSGNRMSGPLVDILCKQATTYPDAALREHAADQTRVLASECLATFTASDAQRVLDALHRLVPQDRLLNRDCQRFLQQKAKKPKLAPPVSRAAKGAVQLVREAKLPEGSWVTAAASDDAMIAAGFRGRELIAARLAWENGQIDTPFYSSWRVESPLVGTPVLLAVDPLGNAPAVIHMVGSTETLASYSFRPTATLPSPLVIGPRRGLSQWSMAAVYSGREALHIADFDGDTVVVNAFMSSTVQMFGLVSLGISEFAAESFALASPLPMLVRETVICLALGPYLCSIARRQERKTFDFEQPIVRLVGSSAHTRPRIAVSLEQGGVMLWGDTADASQTRFAHEMPRPHLALTRGGHLVAASLEETLVYSARDSKLHLHANFGRLAAEPVALLTTRRANEYVLVLADGRVLTFAVPE